MNEFKVGDYICPLNIFLDMGENFFRVDAISGNQVIFGNNSVQYNFLRLATDEEIKAGRRL